MEIEADILAFSTLLGFCSDICMEDSPNQNGDAGTRHYTEGDQYWRESMIFNELTLYATCICLCILDIKRRELGGTGVYPRPFTRILAVFRQFVISTRKTLKSEVADDGSVSLSFFLPEAEAEIYATILVNTIDICNFCFDITGLRPEAEYQLDSEASFLNDALSISNLVERKPLQTREAIELSSLDASVMRYKRMMRRHRIEPWDIR